MVVALFSACAVEPASESQAEDSSLVSAAVSVDVWVVKRNDGTGNELWDAYYTQSMLQHASSHVASTVDFRLRNFTSYYSTDDYELNQDPLHSRLKRLRHPHVITVVISSPATTDSAGVATIQYSNAPFLVMRSRVQDWSSLDSTSCIFLHELGHNMALRHEPQDGARIPFHADDYWQRLDGRQYLLQYACFLHPSLCFLHAS